MSDQYSFLVTCDENDVTIYRHAFATMSFIAETFIFLYVGMDALDIDKWRSSKARYSCIDLHLLAENSSTDNPMTTYRSMQCRNFHSTQFNTGCATDDRESSICVPSCKFGKLL